MRFLRVIVLCAITSVSSAALACEPPVFPFKEYAPSPDIATHQAASDFVATSAPIVSNLRIARATGGSSSICGTQAYISLDISMPGGTKLKLGDVGFGFRHVKGRFYDHVFPTETLMPYDEKLSRVAFLNSWGEGAPAAQKVIDAEIAVFFVAPDGSTGPETVITLFSEPDVPPDKESETR